MAKVTQEQVKEITAFLEENWSPLIAAEFRVDYWNAVAVDLYLHLTAHGVKFYPKED